MTDVTQVKNPQVAASRDAEAKRQVMEQRKLREQFVRELGEENEKNKLTVGNLKKDYDIKFSQEKGELDKKLVEVRDAFAERIRLENERFESELSLLKRAHADQVGEIKVSQVKEIENLNSSHKNYLDSAKTKFQAEKAKYRA